MRFLILGFRLFPVSVQLEPKPKPTRGSFGEKWGNLAKIISFFKRLGSTFYRLERWWPLQPPGVVALVVRSRFKLVILDIVHLTGSGLKVMLFYSSNRFLQSWFNFKFLAAGWSMKKKDAVSMAAEFFPFSPNSVSIWKNIENLS